jgi:hypothetical protein
MVKMWGDGYVNCLDLIIIQCVHVSTSYCAPKYMKLNENIWN